MVDDALAPPGGIPARYLLLIALIAITGVLLLVAGAGGFALPGRLAAIILLGALATALVTHLRRMARTLRDEQRRAEALQDAIRLRRWPTAYRMVSDLVAVKGRNPRAQVQILTLLTLLLGREGRFDEAAALQGALLQRITGPAAATLRVGRIMALLRCDRLVDADAVLRDLQRSVASGEAPAEATGGLRLTEMLRDLVTNHLEEVLAAYHHHLNELREGLGVRVADAHAVAAVAFHRLGEMENAAEAWRKATLLTGPAELVRRYPEAEVLREVAP